MLPDSAAGMLQEVVNVMRDVRADARPLVFGRRVAIFKFQKWRLGAARELCATLVSLLPPGPDAVA